MGLKSTAWSYLVNLAISLDCVVMMLLGGHQGETLSSCSYRMHRDGRRWGFMLHAIEFIFGKGHCWEAYLTDRTRDYPK